MRIRNVFGRSFGKTDGNQDVYQIVSNDRQVSVVLADGAGGVGSGLESANCAVDSCKQALSDAYLNGEKAVTSIVYGADRSLEASNIGGLTTLIAVVFEGDQLFGASVGDSVIWTMCAEGQLVDITANQQRKPLIGSGRAVVTTFRQPFRSRVIVMSDGFYRYLPAAAISDALRSADPEAAVVACAAIIVKSQGTLPDDATAVVVDPSA